MLKAIDNILTSIRDVVWGIPMIVLILVVGIYLTLRLRGLQVTKLPLAVKNIMKNEKDGKEGEVSSFGALCMALSATIGTGNIVGVATALVAGGPGALLQHSALSGRTLPFRLISFPDQASGERPCTYLLCGRARAPS